MRRVVSLFLPSWPTDRLRRADRSPDPSPLVTVARQGSKRLLAATDARAAALGLRAGMAVAKAQATVPGLRIEPTDPEGDAAALGRLAAWCLRQFTPLAAPEAPDGVWLDVTGGTDLFGGEATLLDQLRAKLAAAGIASRAAIADTPGAAHAFARHGAAAPVTIIPSGKARAAILPLPVAALRLDDPVVQALRTLGFDTVGQLLEAPRAPLARRFGAALLTRLDQAVGAVAEPIEPIAAPGLPRARLGFPEPIATPEDLSRAVGILVERLCEKLRERGLGASRLDLVFKRVDGMAQAVRVGTSAPTRDAAHLLRLLTPRIETVDPGFGVEAITLCAPLTDSLGARQVASELCAAASRTPDLSGLIDMLTNRLGPERVFRARPVESDLPERAWRTAPPPLEHHPTRWGHPSDKDARQDFRPPRAEGWPAHLPRPPRLFTPPRPVTATSMLPDRAPVRFTWERRHYRVRHADGPERVFGEWWRDAAETWAVRDYFQVEDEAGQRFWLFRRGDGQTTATGDLQWFLHGLFG